MTFYGESDQLVVLGGRESRPHGEGADGDIRSLKGNLYRTCRAGLIQATLPEGIAMFRTLLGIAEASITEEPGARKPHAGIRAGAAG